MRDLTIHNAIGRLKDTGDLFAEVLGKEIDMAKTLTTFNQVIPCPLLNGLYSLIIMPRT